MSLTRTNQQLRRYLKAIASDLEQSCVNLDQLAKKLSDASAIALMGLGVYAVNTRNMRTAKAIEGNIAPIDNLPFRSS